MIKKAILFFAAIPLLTSTIYAVEIHVSPNGNDSGPGTKLEPVRTLPHAQQLIRKQLRTSNPQRTVILHDGMWNLSEPLAFGPEDSDVTWRALESGGATISGGKEITGWESAPDGSWSARVSPGWMFRELFVNGERRTRARTPNEGYYRIEQAAPDKRTGFTFKPGEIANVPDLASVELVFLHDWSVTRVGIDSVQESSYSLITKHNIGASARHYAIDWFEKHPRYFLENSISYLDQPGEWFLDVEARKLLYRPFPGETIEKAITIAPLARRLIHVKGSDDQPVERLHFEGINFEHCAWQIPGKGYAEGQANYHEPRTGESGILREIIPAAIQFELAENCSILGSKIQHLGGGGVWFGSRTKNCSLMDSVVSDISGNGILIGEDTGRIAGNTQWWRSKPDQAAQNNSVINCVIEETGQQYYGAVGIWVGLTQGTKIMNNEIRDLPYTGISLGWMWNPTPTPNGNNLVEGNHIHHVMQVLSDGGGIYTLGLQPGTVLRGNIIHDIPVNLGRAESNGMFIDEGSTSITIENNSIYNLTRSPLRFHKAGQNLVRNNLLVVKDGIPPIRYNNTKPENIKQSDNTIASELEIQP